MALATKKALVLRFPRLGSFEGIQGIKSIQGIRGISGIKSIRCNGDLGPTSFQIQGCWLQIC